MKANYFQDCVCHMFHYDNNEIGGDRFASVNWVLFELRIKGEERDIY